MTVKRMIIDTETTGLDPKKNGVIQIAGIILVDGAQVDEFCLDVAPYKGQIVEPDALKVTGKTIDQLRDFMAPEDAKATLETLWQQHVDKYNKYDKFFFMGFNARFDNDFLREFWSRANDKYFGSWFWNPVIDVMSFAAEMLADRRDTMVDSKLSTVAGALGINADNAHDALADCRMTLEIYQKFLEWKR